MRILFTLSLCVLVSALAAPAHAQVGFGGATAINGDEVLVGEAGNRAAPGYVYVYRRDDGGAWAEVAALTAGDAAEGDGFGTSILAEGDTLLVGAVADGRGVVHRFSREDGAWTEVGTLEPSGDGDASGFGSSLARDGDTLLVGAAGAEDGWGALYVFRRQGDGWVQAARLTGERAEMAEYEAAMAGAGEAAGEMAAGGEAATEGEGEAEETPDPTPERFGSSLAIRGDWAFVGAPGANQNAGLVYAFRRGAGGAFEAAGALGDFSQPSDLFGASLALKEGLLAVGAPQVQPLGAVRRFVLDGAAGEWVRDASAFPFEGMAYRFGAALAWEGEDLYVASSLHLDDGGMIYRYIGDGVDFVGVEKIGVPGFVQGDMLAASMAKDGGTIVAGAPGDDSGAGTAVIMTRGYGAWDSTRVVSEIKGLDPVTGGAVECRDGVAGRFACDGVDLVAFLPTHEIGGERGTATNDIWGWTDPETDRDYAVVGLTIATSFVDVTEPESPVYVGRLMRTEGAPASSWRDIKIHADHAFIVSDSAPGHGVQVFDLTRLREFEGEPIEFTEDAHYDRISAAHNIVINEETAFAFVVGASSGGETCGGGLHMINIEDPRNPVFAGCFADASTGIQRTGYSHDAQCVTYQGPHEEYRGREICFGSNETALSVADVTDKRNPVALGRATYPSVAYAHQGWLTDDHRYFYMNDEGDEASGLVEGTRTLIWDVQELDDPILVGEYVSDNPAVDHNLYVRGTRMYQSNYDSGLRIFDVTDPESPRPLAFFDTVPFGEDGGGMNGSWSNYPYFDSGVVVVTSMGEGLFVLRVRDDVE